MILIIYTFSFKVNSLYKKKKKVNSFFVHFIYLCLFLPYKNSWFSLVIHIFLYFSVLLKSL